LEQTLFLKLVNYTGPTESVPDSAEAIRHAQSDPAAVVRLTALWNDAYDLWKHAPDALDFLFRPHPMLVGQRPIDVALVNQAGTDAVADILGGLRYGSAP
jgi:putative toxin-antitoxin system antitoxin component (TIGR02293 family)